MNRSTILLSMSQSTFSSSFITKRNILETIFLWTNTTSLSITLWKNCKNTKYNSSEISPENRDGWWGRNLMKFWWILGNWGKKLNFKIYSVLSQGDIPQSMLMSSYTVWKFMKMRILKNLKSPTIKDWKTEVHSLIFNINKQLRLLSIKKFVSPKMNFNMKNYAKIERMRLTLFSRRKRIW